MSTKINNIDDLKSEITRISRLKVEQEAFLGDQYRLLRNKIAQPARVLGTLSSAIPGVDMLRGLFSAGASIAGKSKKPGAEPSSSDWLTKTFQIGLPLVLNKTLLKNAGWIKKSLVLLASETAAGKINQNAITSAISKVTDFVKPKKKKKKHRVIEPLQDEKDVINFGIPPDSETY